MFAGIDIGSTTIKFVLLDDSEIVNYEIVKTGYDPAKTVEKLLSKYSYSKLVATGYGRYILESYFDDVDTITEIKAYAIGVFNLFPEARTILDIGGQDIKVILIDNSGKIVKFEMNDKCAAGTGKFLEIMAETLGYSIDELGDNKHLACNKHVVINSTCTVFAESEVISLLTRGEKRENIANAVNRTVVKRAVSMLNRVGIVEPVVFAGGVAKNSCIVSMLKETLNTNVIVSNIPQFIGAYGAAIFASKKFNKISQ